jgi:mRNA-degrading endonuclease YafQ of YafQ-DinJ toxin-antitoxin module
MYALLFPDAYRKAELRFLKRHPDLKARYRKTLEMLGQDPFHPSLRLRPLKGHLAGLHSAPLSLQYRITLELEIREREIVLVSIGSHDEVY